MRGRLRLAQKSGKAPHPLASLATLGSSPRAAELVLATLSCARALLHHHASKNLRPQEGAERRKGACQPLPPRKQACACALLACVRGGSALLRGALAFRRSAAALARANASAVGSAPVPAFPETWPNGRYPLRPVTSLPSSSETGRHAGRAVAQSRPGADGKSARSHVRYVIARASNEFPLPRAREEARSGRVNARNASRPKAFGSRGYGPPSHPPREALIAKKFSIGVRY